MGDSIRNYLSAFADDSWMIDGNYMDPPLSEISDKKVKNLVES